MKISCEIIEDLLGLYAEDACSPQSRELVREHLGNCENCRKSYEQAMGIPEINAEFEHKVNDSALKRSFGKIRLRWIMSLLMVVILIPTLILGVNQYRGQGVSYTNIVPMIYSRIFAQRLCDGEYEKAFELVIVDRIKAEWSQEWFSSDELTDFEQRAKDTFLDCAGEFEGSGGMEKCEYVGISLISRTKKGKPVWRVIFKITANEKSRFLSVDVAADGVENFYSDGSFVTDALADFSMWREYLWQDYKNCYFDPERGEYLPKR